VEQEAKRLSRMNVKDGERELVPLEEAAGKFQALANLIRAT